MKKGRQKKGRLEGVKKLTIASQKMDDAGQTGNSGGTRGREAVKKLVNVHIQLLLRMY